MLVIMRLGFVTRMEVVVAALFLAVIMCMALLPRCVRVLMGMPMRMSVTMRMGMLMDMSDISMGMLMGMLVRMVMIMLMSVRVVSFHTYSPFKNIREYS
jgi:hypothetical protein